MVKVVRTKNYNYNFNMENGYFERWGETKEDDPIVSPLGNEILDIEITDICEGISVKNKGVCKFCYKSNTPNGQNMSFDTFKTIIDKMPKIMCQIALGCDSKGTSNPDMFRMMEYARNNNIIPNVTIAEITDDTAQKLAKLCGAVAVSHYDTEICKNSIALLHKYGLKQINIHQLLSEETLNDCYNIIDEYKKGIPGLNAIVFLSLKKKGRGTNYNQVPYELFKDLIDYAMEANVPIGFDSCTSHKYLRYVNEKNDPELNKSIIYVEPCESMLFSAYINLFGMAYPCSFSPNTPGWEEGIDVTKCNDYIEDIWNNPRMIEWREKLIKNERRCPIYEI